MQEFMLKIKKGFVIVFLLILTWIAFTIYTFPSITLDVVRNSTNIEDGGATIKVNVNEVMRKKKDGVPVEIWMNGKLVRQLVSNSSGNAAFRNTFEIGNYDIQATYIDLNGEPRFSEMATFRVSTAWVDKIIPTSQSSAEVSARNSFLLFFVAPIAGIIFLVVFVIWLRSTVIGRDEERNHWKGEAGIANVRADQYRAQRDEIQEQRIQDWKGVAGGLGHLLREAIEALGGAANRPTTVNVSQTSHAHGGDGGSGGEGGSVRPVFPLLPRQPTPPSLPSSFDDDSDSY